MQEPLIESELNIQPVRTGTEAGRVSDFLLGEHCFDDQRFTPGETDHLRWLPMRSLQEETVTCWYAEQAGEVIAAIIFVENEHRSGGYRLEYFGVHRQHRHRGFGWQLIGRMLESVASRGGRYVETFTCDLPEYAGARKLFERNGFQFLCRMPDYYYPGEGKLLYLRVIS